MVIPETVLFILLLALKSFEGISRFLEMREDVLDGNINKEHVDAIVPLRVMTTHGVWKTMTSCDHLVDTTHFAGLQWSFADGMKVLKGMLPSFAELAFLANRWDTLGKGSRDSYIFASHTLDGGKVHMSKPGTPLVELPLESSEVIQLFLGCVEGKEGGRLKVCCKPIKELVNLQCGASQRLRSE